MTSDLTSGTLFQETRDFPSGHASYVNHVRDLVDSLENSRLAVLRSDLKGLIHETARQRELCVFVSAQVRGENDLRGYLSELQEVSRASRMYAAVLARARRTADIFCRVLANSQLTYVPPTTSFLPRVGP